MIPGNRIGLPERNDGTPVVNMRESLDRIRTAQRDGSHLWVTNMIVGTSLTLTGDIVTLVADTGDIIAIPDPYCIVCLTDFRPWLIESLCGGNGFPICPNCGIGHPEGNGPHE